MPNKLQDPHRHKFEKAKYKISNSREYDQALKNRGSLTIWFSEESIAGWNNIDIAKNRKRGRPATYSDLAIETCVTLGLVYKQRLRQTEGFVESIIKLLQLDLQVPDHTTISRRSGKIKISKSFKTKDKPLVVAIDSTGLKIYGEQEWQEEKYLLRTRKSWRKLHIGIDDEDGSIISSELTSHLTSDSATM
jgi:hypothetical protein